MAVVACTVLSVVEETVGTGAVAKGVGAKVKSWTASQAKSKGSASSALLRTGCGYDRPVLEESVCRKTPQRGIVEDAVVVSAASETRTVEEAGLAVRVNTNVTNEGLSISEVSGKATGVAHFVGPHELANLTGGADCLRGAGEAG